jgi:hypothetical protein
MSEGNVIEFPKTAQQIRERHGNGNDAREAVMTIAGESPEHGDPELRADCFLAELWRLGFKVVPLD